MDLTEYNKIQDRASAEFEAICKRCGECCGAGTDEPCANLASAGDGKYFCRSYQNRLGMQRTVSGRVFTCVNIRDVIAKGLPYGSCAYSP
jgi:uncharacterized cysteine cluster protein YcgN (CxxCxxCC family)